MDKMKTIIWIFLLVALTAESSLAKVGNVKITSVPQDRIVVEGKSITFTCDASCDNGTCEFKPSKTKIIKVTRNMQTSFNCTVVDSGDRHSMSKIETFVVHYGPDNGTEAGIFNSAGNRIGKTLEVIEGENPNLYCRRGACSDCTLSWEGNGNVPSNVKNEKLQLFVSDTQISRKNAGPFICTAKNTFSNATWKKDFTLVVLYHPEVSLTWNPATKVLTCAAYDGVPKNYTYYDIVHRVETIVVRNIRGRIEGNKTVHRFDSMSYQDYGEYSCTANNGISSNRMYNITAKKTIQVEDKPVLVTSTDRYNVSKGHKLTMKMSLYANPGEITIALEDSHNNDIYHEIERKWTPVQTEFHGKRVEVQGIHLNVTISEVLESYFDETLTMLIDNRRGHINRTVKLFPQGPPDIPGNFSLTEKSHNMVKFQLITGFFNGANQTLVLEYRRPGNTSDWKNGTSKEAGADKNNLFELSIYGLEPETTYEFRAFSYNTYNTSSYTAVITETLRPTPIPYGKIVGGTLAGLLVIIIIVVIVIKCRRENSEDLQKDRRRKQFEKNRELVASIPMPRVFADNEYSSDPVTRDSTDADAGSDLNNETYVNTQVGPTKSTKISHKSSTPRQESVIYQNTSLQTFGAQNKRYSLTQDNEQTMAPYLELAGSGEGVEEAYLTMTDTRALAKTPKRDATPELDIGYLDMNQSKALVEATRKKHASETRSNTMESVNSKALKQHKSANDSNDYSNMSFRPQTEDYENVTEKISPPTQHQLRGVRSKRSTSIPDHVAPPPPQPLEEDEANYMNIRLKH